MAENTQEYKMLTRFSVRHILLICRSRRTLCTGNHKSKEVLSLPSFGDAWERRPITGRALRPIVFGSGGNHFALLYSLPPPFSTPNRTKPSKFYRALRSGLGQYIYLSPNSPPDTRSSLAFVEHSLSRGEHPKCTSKSASKATSIPRHDVYSRF